MFTFLLAVINYLAKAAKGGESPGAGMSKAAGHTVMCSHEAEKDECWHLVCFLLYTEYGPLSPWDGALNIQDVFFVQLNLSANTLINMW